jgi:hypothetical protein
MYLCEAINTESNKSSIFVARLLSQGRRIKKRKQYARITTLHCLVIWWWEGSSTRIRLDPESATCERLLDGSDNVIFSIVHRESVNNCGMGVRASSFVGHLLRILLAHGICSTIIKKSQQIRHEHRIINAATSDRGIWWWQGIFDSITALDE